MYVKIDGELKKVKRIEIKSDTTAILIHTKTETGLEEEYNCYSDSQTTIIYAICGLQISTYPATFFAQTKNT